MSNRQSGHLIIKQVHQSAYNSQRTTVIIGLMLRKTRLVATFLTFVIAACNRKPPEPPYTPGLGEIMTFQQMRHVKLWLAGQAGNWPLASYELDELNEGFD